MLTAFAVFVVLGLLELLWKTSRREPQPPLWTAEDDLRKERMRDW